MRSLLKFVAIMVVFYLGANYYLNSGATPQWIDQTLAQKIMYKEPSAAQRANIDKSDASRLANKEKQLATMKKNVETLKKNINISIQNYNINSTATNKAKIANYKKTLTQTSKNVSEITREIKEMKNKNTCDNVIATFRPKNLPKAFPVKCVDYVSSTSGNSAGVAGTIISRVYNSDGYSLGKPIEIQIKRGFTVEEIKGILTHEAHHYDSFTWSTEKQKAFLDTHKVKGWSDGDYYDRVSEKWAFTASACDGYTNNYSYNELPGGCEAVKKWQNR